MFKAYPSFWNRNWSTGGLSTELSACLRGGSSRCLFLQTYRDQSDSRTASKPFITFLLPDHSSMKHLLFHDENRVRSLCRGWCLIWVDFGDTASHISLGGIIESNTCLPTYLLDTLQVASIESHAPAHAHQLGRIWCYPEWLDSTPYLHTWSGRVRRTENGRIKRPNNESQTHSLFENFIMAVNA